MYLIVNLEYLVYLAALALCPNFADLRVRTPPDSRPPKDGDPRYGPPRSRFTASFRYSPPIIPMASIVHIIRSGFNHLECLMRWATGVIKQVYGQIQDHNDGNP